MLVHSIFSGIFAPVSKIAKPGSSPQKSLTPSPVKQPLVKSSSVDVSRVTARVDTGQYMFYNSYSDQDVIGDNAALFLFYCQVDLG